MIERIACPLSGASAEVIFSRPYSLAELRPFAERAGLAAQLRDKPYEIRFCAASDLHFQTWVMDDSELAGLYSRPADEKSFMTEIGKQELHWFAHLTEEILVLRQLVAARVPAVLDFGCNWGKWASMALAHGCEVFGVDVNRAAAAFCAARGIKMVSFDELAELRFDFINADQVFEHLSDPLRIARQLGACLKPGAFLKLGTPGNARLPHLLADAQRTGDNQVLSRRWLDPLLPLEHVNLFSRHSLAYLATEVGLNYFRLPFFKWLGAGQLWNLPRQLNRNLVTPWKRFRGGGTYLWFQKPP